jgi:ABC-type branched-subunit amino acid transport system ATPase component
VTPVAPLLEVRGLSKQFGGLGAVADLSFTVEPGSIVGLKIGRAHV